MKNRKEAGQGSFIRLSAPPERMAVGQHSGPGLRLIFWVQGCSLLCTRNCLNPHLLKQDGGYLVRTTELTQMLLRLAGDYKEVEGVTVLGGEPFDQAEALAEVLAPVHATGLSIMLYSGHTLEALQAAGDDARHLLGLCDILVDGPFIDEQYAAHLIWRGSLNQRILALSDRYSNQDIEAAIARQKRGVALSVGVRGDVAVSGAQNVQVARQLRQLTTTDSPVRTRTGGEDSSHE